MKPRATPPPHEPGTLEVAVVQWSWGCVRSPEGSVRPGPGPPPPSLHSASCSPPPHCKQHPLAVTSRTSPISPDRPVRCLFPTTDITTSSSVRVSCQQGRAGVLGGRALLIYCVDRFWGDWIRFDGGNRSWFSL